ncbi:MAG: methyltransferase domain-containing protein [Nitrososphaeria archaeon]
MKTVLDVGCGSHPTGTVNIDIDPNSKADLTLSVYQLDSFFKPNSFDEVHAYEVLEHLSNPGQGLLQIRRVLRPGGILRLSVPNIWYWKVLVRCRWGKSIEGGFNHTQCWTITEISTLLARHGFDIKMIHYGTLQWQGKPSSLLFLPSWLRHRCLMIDARLTESTLEAEEPVDRSTGEIESQTPPISSHPSMEERRKRSTI